MRLILASCYLMCFILVALSSSAQDNSKVLIAAASDLKYALDSVVTFFKKYHPQANIEVTYGSTGKLFEQIQHSAPFDMFFSADIEYPKQLKAKKIASSDVFPYAIGRIVIWSKKIDPNVNKMNSLTDKSINKIAIANPLHAPYGKRAEESLKYYKLLDVVTPKLVYGENISQTAQFVTTGAADIGIVALSLALSPAMKLEGGKYYIIPQSSHKPLEQGFVILNHGSKNVDAVSFKDFMLTSGAKSILNYYGFTH
ncbi:MAG: molybdate ABC transporter substrate-binding protein [Chryseolinea sp.]